MKWVTRLDYAPFTDSLLSVGKGLAMINLHTKFEVSKFTHYEDMKGNEKRRN